MRQALLAHFLFLNGLGLAACSPAPDTVECARLPVIYGTDNRIEAREHPAGVDLIASSVALIAAEQIDRGPDGNFAIGGGRLTSSRKICADERFSNQRSAALCSGVLIDDDLVLTAGHCFKRRPEGAPVAAAADVPCTAYRYVLGYNLTGDSVAPIPASNVFSCRRMVVQRLDEDFSNPWLDYAIVQLDRPVGPEHMVMPLALDYLPQPGDRLILYGYPDGLPLKVDDSGMVRANNRPAGDYFLAALDAFKGNSGSPVLNVGGAVAGVLVGGATDYFKDETCGNGCMRPRQIQAGVVSGLTEKRGERVAFLQPIIAAMCNSGWPSPRLCKDSFPICPDSICSAYENCPQDCPQPVCGDRICEQAEELNASCPMDCDRRSNAPEDWICPGGYMQRDGCNCNCGAFDPDCADPAAAAEACGPNSFCNDTGNCEVMQGPTGGNPDMMSMLPPGWDAERSGCSASYYGDRNGCDCGCGARDIDCDDPDSTVSRVLNCMSGQTCSAQGTCEGTALPSGWNTITCPAATYEDGATCHCGCGAVDPDCGWQVPIANCPEGWACTSGECVNPNPSPSMTFTGSVGPRMEARHVMMVGPSPRVRVELMPTGGDADLYIGNASLTRTMSEDSSIKSGTQTDDCELENVTAPRELHILVWNHEMMNTVNYTVVVHPN